MRLLLAGVLCVGAFGCGGGERDDADLDPIEVAVEFVAALNESDYGRACELSTGGASTDSSCERLLEEAFRNQTFEPPEGAYLNRSEKQSAGGSFSAFRRGGGAPLTFEVEEGGGRHLVHIEVSVIR